MVGVPAYPLFHERFLVKLRNFDLANLALKHLNRDLLILLVAEFLFEVRLFLLLLKSLQLPETTRHFIKTGFFSEESTHSTHSADSAQSVVY